MIHVGEPNEHGLRRACTDAVLGRAIAHILIGDLPDREHNCCHVAKTHNRLCWHQAAHFLIANGIQPPD
jgi:hypothetical protein